MMIPSNPEEKTIRELGGNFLLSPREKEAKS
jgi:hypothetical protein